MKAAYLSYCVVSFILLFIKEIQNNTLNSMDIFIFNLHFSNVDNLINFVHRLLKFSVVIFDIIMEATMSQIFYLGPSSYFMWYRKRKSPLSILKCLLVIQGPPFPKVVDMHQRSKNHEERGVSLICSLVHEIRKKKPLILTEIREISKKGS